MCEARQEIIALFGASGGADGNGGVLATFQMKQKLKRDKARVQEVGRERGRV